MTFILIVPLLWMLITSLEDRRRGQPVPPVLIPERPRFENYSEAWATAVRPLLPQQCPGDVGGAGQQPHRVQQPGYAFARIRFLGRRRTTVTLMATLMVPFRSR